MGIPNPNSTVAIEIKTFYQGGSPPNWDPNGMVLESVADSAASIWEALYPFNDTSYEVDLFWEDLPDNLLGKTWPGTFSPFDFTDSITLDTHVNIVGNSKKERDWYVDSTPLDNDEFDMESTYYTDLSASQRDSWFDGNPPSYLEVGYRGKATIGTPAAERDDLFSTLVHEFGHVLGIQWAGFGDWDLIPAHVGYHNMTVVQDGLD